MRNDCRVQSAMLSKRNLEQRICKTHRQRKETKRQLQVVCSGIYLYASCYWSGLVWSGLVYHHRSLALLPKQDNRVYKVLSNLGCRVLEYHILDRTQVLRDGNGVLLPYQGIFGIGSFLKVFNLLRQFGAGGDKIQCSVFTRSNPTKSRIQAMLRPTHAHTMVMMMMI